MCEQILKNVASYLLHNQFDRILNSKKMNKRIQLLKSIFFIYLHNLSLILNGHCDTNSVQKSKNLIEKNIAGRLPENIRNRFVDRQSKKTVKKTDKKIRLFIEG